MEVWCGARGVTRGHAGAPLNILREYVFCLRGCKFALWKYRHAPASLEWHEGRLRLQACALHTNDAMYAGANRSYSKRVLRLQQFCAHFAAKVACPACLKKQQVLV